jgi:hypothetical protein
MGSKWGIKRTLLTGLSLQLVGIGVMFGWRDDWALEASKWKAIVFVTCAQVGGAGPAGLLPAAAAPQLLRCRLHGGVAACTASAILPALLLLLPLLLCCTPWATAAGSRRLPAEPSPASFPRAPSPRRCFAGWPRT